MANGVARKVDQLGRVVLPVEMRKALHIDVGDLVMMSDEGDRIVLEKVEQRCVFCGASTRDAAETVSARLGIARRAAYERAVTLKGR